MRRNPPTPAEPLAVSALVHPGRAMVPHLKRARPELLRVVEGAVVDFPLPTLDPGTRRWAATCWPDPEQPGGWRRALWWPSPWHRGFLPVGLNFADVIEFGSDVALRRRWPLRARWVPVRWYGVLLEDSEQGLVAHGPYPDPSSALSAADELRVTLACRRVWRRPL
jgi:hypothetical protein